MRLGSSGYDLRRRTRLQACSTPALTRRQSAKPDRETIEAMNMNDRPGTLAEIEDHGAFVARHIGTSPDDQRGMLRTLGVDSRAALIDAVVPRAIRDKAPLALPAPLSEAEALARLEAVASKNRVAKSFIGLGYYGTRTPAVIQRNVLENPAWYTAYTPYQPEISQGRLEALINFQTMVCDLAGMAIEIGRAHV